MGVRLKIILLILATCAMARRIAGIKVASHMPIAIRGLNEDEDDGQDEDLLVSGQIDDEDGEEEEQEPSKVTGAYIGSFEKSNAIKNLDLPEGYEDMLKAQEQEKAMEQDEEKEDGQEEEQAMEQDEENEDGQQEEQAKEQDEEKEDGHEDEEQSDDNADLVDQNIFISEKQMRQNGFEDQEMQNVLKFIEFKVNHIQELMENCINKQFTDDVMATVKSVKEFCVGLSFQILFEDYRDGLRAMKQSIMEVLHIKFEVLPRHFEDEIDFFFTLLEQFIDKDLALPKSLKVAKKGASYSVNTVHFDHLIKLSKREISTFDEIHKRIKKTRDKVAKMLEDEMVQQEAYVEDLTEQADAIKANEEEEYAKSEQEDYGGDDIKEETPEEESEEEREEPESEKDDDDDDDDDDDQENEEPNFETKADSEKGEETDAHNNKKDTEESPPENQEKETDQKSEQAEGTDLNISNERKLNKSRFGVRSLISGKQAQMATIQPTNSAFSKSVKIIPKAKPQVAHLQSPKLAIESGLTKKH